MKAGAFILKLSSGVAAIPRGRFRLMIWIAALTTSFNFVWWFRTPALYEEFVTVSSAGTEIRSDLTVPLIRTRVAFVLMVSTLGLASKSWLGFLISTLGLLQVCVDYVFWYLESAKRLKRMGPTLATLMLQPEGYLWSGAWWNIFVLLITIILLCWELRILTRCFKFEPET
jgi:hypothetical protein